MIFLAAPVPGRPGKRTCAGCVMGLPDVYRKSTTIASPDSRTEYYFIGKIGKKELRFRGWFDIISTQAGI